MFYCLILIPHLFSIFMYPAAPFSTEMSQQHRAYDDYEYGNPCAIGPNPLYLGHSPEEQNLARAMQTMRNLIASEDEMSGEDYAQAINRLSSVMAPCLTLQNKFKQIFWKHAILQFTAEQQELILCHPTAKLLQITTARTYARNIRLINTWKQEHIRISSIRCIKAYENIRSCLCNDNHYANSKIESLTNDQFITDIPKIMRELIAFIIKIHTLELTDPIKRYMFRSQAELTRAINTIEPQPADANLIPSVSSEAPEEF